MMRETKRRGPWKLAHWVTGAGSNTGQAGPVHKDVPIAPTFFRADHNPYRGRFSIFFVASDNPRPSRLSAKLRLIT